MEQLSNLNNQIDMIKILLISLVTISTILVSSCGNTEKKNEEKTTSEIPTASPEEMLQKEASRLRAGGAVKDAILENGKATIKYVRDFEEYIKINPQSSLKKSDFISYWDSGDAIEKAFVDGSVRLMKKLDFLNQVIIILPVNDKTYTIDVSKSELTKYINADFEKIKSNWDETFSNPYVYSSSGRKKFFEKFGKVE